MSAIVLTQTSGNCTTYLTADWQSWLVCPHASGYLQLWYSGQHTQCVEFTSLYRNYITDDWTDVRLRYNVTGLPIQTGDIPLAERRALVHAENLRCLGCACPAIETIGPAGQIYSVYPNDGTITTYINSVPFVQR